jgi:hypothetical protein
MSIPDRSNDTHVPAESSDHDTPKRSGFGEFSAMYRTRWAMSHPNMRGPWPAEGHALPLALPDAAAAEPTLPVIAPRRNVPNGDE